MDSIIGKIAEFGVVGIVAVIWLRLYLEAQKELRELRQQLLQQVKEYTAAQMQHAASQEHVAAVIEEAAKITREGTEACRGTVGQLLRELREERARDEGRKEATDPHIKIPKRAPRKETER